MNSTKSIVVSVLLAALAVLVAPAASLAGKPIREQTPVGSGFTNAPGDACTVGVAPAGVRVELVQGPWTTRFFENGRVLMSGTHVDRVTNVATGASVLVPLHGSFAVEGDTIRASGRTGLVLLPGDAGPGDVSTGRVYVFTGTVRIRMDESGVFADVEWTGEAEDVCALIG